MNCSDLERWFDDGMPANEAARLHANTCGSCAARLRSAEALEVALSAGIAAHDAAPGGFTDVVMRRVGLIEAARPVSDIRVNRGAFPWWARVAAEPSVAAAFVLCALILWKSPVILSAGARAFVWLRAIDGQSLTSGIMRFDAQNPTALTLALGIVVLLATLWLSRGAYQWTSRAVAHATMPHLHHGLASH